MRRKLSKYQIYDDDCVFFYNTPYLSTQPFVDLVSDQIGMKPFTGAPEEYNFRRDSSFIVGGMDHWKELIYPKIDPNPLMLTLLQDPFSFVLESYWCIACNIPRNPQAEFSKIRETPSLSLEEFLRNPSYSQWIDNRQWNSLLGLCDVWVEGMGNRISVEGQRRLVEERLEQMAFIGLVEHPEHLTDLFCYTFNLEHRQPSALLRLDLEIFDPAFRKEIVSPTFVKEIRKRVQLDQQLYRFTTNLFFQRYQQMARRQAVELNWRKMACPGIQIIPLAPEEQFSRLELTILRGFQKLRHTIFPVGSKREAWIYPKYLKIIEKSQFEERRSGDGCQPSPREYNRWLLDKDRTSDPGTVVEEGRLFSVIMFLSPDNPDAFKRTLRSLKESKWKRWELLVFHHAAEGTSGDDDLELGFDDQRIRWIALNADFPSGRWMLSDVMQQVQGGYVIFVGCGDILSGKLFFEVSKTLDQREGGRPIDILYFDEDAMDDSGNRFDPWLKPSTYSPEMLLSVNYLERALFRRQIFHEQWTRQIGMPLQSADAWTLAFRCVEEVRGDIIHLPEILYHQRRDEDFGYSHCEKDGEQLKVIEGHLARMDRRNARALLTPNGSIQVKWDLSDVGKVSIIIPTKNQLNLIERCVKTILTITEYPDYEIILVDTGSVDPRVRLFYSKVVDNVKVKLIRLKGKFNYSRANNRGVTHAIGSYLLFLNNDTEPLHDDWLREMVRWVESPDIGVVSAKLLYPDGMIQSFGTILGMHGHAQHIFAGMPENCDSIFGSTHWYRNYSAVTGACMMMRRDVFQEVGGFNTDYSIAFSDVEICLRALASGYRILCTPFSRIRHHEGRSRSGSVPLKDMQVGLSNFGGIIHQGDGYFNKNLSLDSTIPMLRQPGEIDPIKRISQVAYQRRAMVNED